MKLVLERGKYYLRKIICASWLFHTNKIGYVTNAMLLFGNKIINNNKLL